MGKAVKTARNRSQQGPQFQTKTTLPFLGELFGLGVQRVTALARDGVIPRDQSRTYKLGPCVRAYVEHLRGDTRKSTESDSRSLLTEARTEEMQLRLEQKRGTLVDANEVAAVYSSHIVSARNRLLVIGDRFRQHFRAPEDGTRADFIEKEITLALKELAEAA